MEDSIARFSYFTLLPAMRNFNLRSHATASTPPPPRHRLRATASTPPPPRHRLHATDNHHQQPQPR
ncbi:hypothetical protein [Corynebacterium durum]|uniref:hypothetical protein n=1 Tax=Corynebacterium durum TaxID=61592 RepID=UPI0028E44233|nr:hypothetical protein [Corynebacterium durum]